MTMALRRYLRPETAGAFAAAVVIGLGVGALAQSDPVALPYLGETSQYLVGTGGVLGGGALYALVPDSEDCGCGGSCGC